MGVGAALVAPPVATFEWGAIFGVDGLSGVVLVALLLVGACGAVRPLGLGLLVLGVLAGDAVGLVVCVGGAGWLASRGDWRVVAGGVVCLVGALVVLGWPGDLRFAAIRVLPPGGVAGVLLPVVAVGAAALLGRVLGGVVAVYVLGRLLLDLAGPVTPGWWGVPVLAGGMAVAVVMARRAAAAQELGVVVRAVGDAVAGLAVAGLGVALLARGADLAPLVALGVGGSLLLMVGWGVWGGLLLLAGGAVEAAAGTGALVRMGGLLRRMPMTGLALLIGLGSAAAVPLTPGFAGVWVLLQALLAAARSGGTGAGTVVLALVAGGVAAAGLVVALLGVAAVRVGGLALLGGARSARAGAAPDAPGGVRLGMAALGVVALVMGVVPWLAMVVVQPGVRLLAGVAAEGLGVWGFAAEGGGYSAPGVALLVGGFAGLAAWGTRGAGQAIPAWRGGLAGDGAGDGVGAGLGVVLWPGWRGWRPVMSGRVVLVGLGLVLAAALGWAAR